jgi:sugar O-acyltransferase (sialic acid O-acetyltransferase NeuD family)
MKTGPMFSRQNSYKIAIIGTGGFATGDILYICNDIGYKKIVFVDPVNRYPTSKDIFGYPLLGEDEISGLEEEDYNFIIAIGDNKYRKAYFLKHNKLKYTNVIHPSSSIGFMQLKSIDKTVGNIIAAGARFANNILFGNFGVFNFNCTVGHDCVLFDYINISPGANVSGKVILEECSFIGTNAAIREGHSTDHKLKIGSHAVIGAGAVVLNDVPSQKTVVGIPAKIVK